MSLFDTHQEDTDEELNDNEENSQASGVVLIKD
jgi:hypothetical protein